MPWSTEIARTGLWVVPYIKIDGIPLRIFTITPTGWAADAWTNVDGLDVTGTIEQSFQSGDAQTAGGRSNVGHLKIVVTDLPLSGPLAPYRFSRYFGATSRAFADSTAWTAALAADLDPGDLTVTVTNNTGMPALPFDAHVGNECVTIQALVAGLTYTITRNVYPAIAGTTWGLWHHIGDGAAPFVYPISTVPYNWFNRRVALYYTWKNQDGTFGPLAEAHRRWIGRIKSVRFVGNDRWELDCAPVTDELERPILAPTPKTTQVAMDIDFRGTSDDVRYVQFAPTAAGVTTNYETTISASRFDSVVGLYREIESVIRAASVPATDGFVNFARGEDEAGAEQTEAHWNPLINPALTRAKVLLSPQIGMALGYEAQPFDFGVESYSFVEIRWEWGGGASPPPPPVIAPNPYAKMFWMAQCSNLRVRDASGFTAAAMGDGSWPAVEIMGQVVRRYSSVVANDLVTPYSHIQDNTTYHVGPSFLFIPHGDTETFTEVRQVYLTPRTWGVENATDWTVIANLLRLIVSTGSGLNWSGAGTNYDVYPREYGLGIPIDAVDVDSFLFARDLMPDVLERRWCLREATSLADVIDTECRTLGLFIVMDGSGRIACRVARDPLPATTIVTLNEGNKGTKAGESGRSELDISAGTIINAGTLRFGYPILGDGEPAGETNIGNPLSQAMFGEQRGEDIEHRGLADFGGGEIRTIIDGLWSQVARTSYPQAKATRSISRDLFTRMVPGDVVLLTDSAILDTDTGDRGVTDRPFTVRSVSEDLHAGRGTVTLVRDSIRPSSHETPVCPSARVTAAVIIGAGPNYRLTIAANDFTNAADGVDRDSFQNTDEVIIFEGDAQDPTVVVSVTRQIIAIGPGANQIDIDGDVSTLTPATNIVYLTFARHITAGAPCVTAAQLPRGTWFAGSDNLILNSTVYRAHVYDG